LRSRINLDQTLKNLNGALCDTLVQAGIERPDALCKRLATLLAGSAR
jgi:hypothetical protein